MEKHRCCSGNHLHNYVAYIMGAIIVIVIILAFASTVFGTTPVNNEMTSMMTACSQMMGIGMMQQMQSGGMMPGMSQEEHESHHT